MYDLNNLYLSMMTNETFNDDQDDDAIWQKEAKDNATDDT
jgi:hypothetical protein